jgi:hypothetical protein
LLVRQATIVLPIAKIGGIITFAMKRPKIKCRIPDKVKEMAKPYTHEERFVVEHRGMFYHFQYATCCKKIRKKDLEKIVEQAGRKLKWEEVVK